MEFIETPLFSKLLPKYLSDDEFHELELCLIDQPDLGDEIRGSGGIRKLRWAYHERGKRGGLRIIYYWVISRDQIYFLYLYPKNKADDLTADQLNQLRRLVEIELKARS